MRPGGAVDVLIVSLGSTEGLRRADEELRDSLRRAGADVALARAHAPVQRPTLMLTDLVWARAARTAARKALGRFADAPPRAIIYSSTTAALLWPRPGAIRFDAPSAGNRPGRHGLWQRPLERRRLERSTLLLPWSEGALRELPARAGAETGAQAGAAAGAAEASAGGERERAIVLPVPVEPSGPPGQQRDIAAITYAANPSKKGFGRVLSAWRQVRSRRPGEELLVAGASLAELAAAGHPVESEEGVRVVGSLPPQDYRALLRRARVFVCAPRREDHGIAQLEALVDGCLLVTTPAPGPYAALPVARALDGRLVGEDLSGALSTALEEPLEGYAERAREALSPLARESVDRLVAERLLPRLFA